MGRPLSKVESAPLAPLPRRMNQCVTADTSTFVPICNADSSFNP